MIRTVRRVLVLGMLLGSLAPSVAGARTTRDFTYPYAQVWNSLVRLIRVDYRFPIDERDDEHGFVLFQYREYGRTHPASVELVRTPTPQGERVRVVLALNGMPAATEARIFDDLLNKLRSDYGDPPAPEAGADAGVTAQSLMPRLTPAPSRIPNDPPTPTRDSTRTPPATDSSPTRPPHADGVRPSGSDEPSATEPRPAPGTGNIRLR